MSGDRATALGAGCAGYISKPIDTRTLGAQVRRYLGTDVKDDRPRVAS